MKKQYITAVAATTALLFIAAPIAQASIVAGASGEVKIEAGEMEMHTDMKVGATVTPMKGMQHMDGMRMEEGVNTASGMKMEGGKMEMEGDMHDMKGGEKGSDHATGTMHAMENADEHALPGLKNAMMHIELQGDTKDDATEEAETVDMDSAMKVHSDHDFEHFVMHKGKEDAHLKGVTVAEGKMHVAYETPAKLFGFIKTSITAQTSVDEEGNVEVEYPWYHIFMKSQVAKESLQSDIARAVAAERKAEKEGMGTTTIEAKIETSLGIPNLFEIIANALKDASVKAEGSASAE